jgi:hypothetical protein
MKVKRFEFGLNIELPFITQNILDNIGTYKKKGFCTLIRKNKVYGKKLFMENFEFKLYDKALETKLNVGKDLLKFLLRIEVTVKSKDQIGYIRTVDDLTDFTNMVKLYIYLLKCLSNIDMRDLSNLEQIKSQSRNLLFAGLNEEFWRFEKQINPNTQKKKRDKYLEIKRSASSDPMKQIVIEKMIDSIGHVIDNNSFFPLLYNKRKKG